MTKSGTSNLPFTILISPYPMGQPALLEKFSWTIPNPQQWHQALALAETPRHALVWAQQFRCSWGLLQTRDSRTKRCRLKPVVPDSQTTKKRKDYFDVAGTTGSNRWLKEWPLCFGSSSRLSYERVRMI